VPRDSPILILELESEEVDILPKFMLSVKLFVRELSLSIKNSLMNNPNVKLKKFSLLMIDPCLLLILEDVNLRNTVVQGPEPESKSLTDESIL
jgi:hypothetical protein